MKRIHFVHAAGAATMLLLLAACHKDKPEPPVQGQGQTATGHGVYITNEGNFQWGNASVGWYDPATGQATEDLYAAANGTGMGDVCQSMCLHDGKAYIVLNNSAKVTVVDAETFVATATITGFSSPRYFLPVGNGKAYVTEMSGNKVRVVDLNTSTIIGSIACAGVTQELALAAGKVFITNESKPYVYVVDPATDAITDSVAVSRGGGTLTSDADGMLWVACTGGGGTPAALYRIDPQTVEVANTVPIPGPRISPWRLRANGTGDTLYLLNGGVYRLSITDAAFPSAAFIPANGRNLYGLGIDPLDGNIYVADAIDYVQRGKVYQYAANGAEVGNFLAGRIPNGFVFR
ncbi:MAG TPA: YncE family protein [Flavobacteriales bacterium]|nr:YncE family protein [Flavobacteriales bacterium]